MSARERVLRALKAWASRQIERRVRAEWEHYRGERKVSWPLLRRAGSRQHVTRSLIQINFFRHEGEWPARSRR